MSAKSGDNHDSTLDREPFELAASAEIEREPVVLTGAARPESPPECEDAEEEPLLTGTLGPTDIPMPAARPEPPGRSGRSPWFHWALLVVIASLAVGLLATQTAQFVRQAYEVHVVLAYVEIGSLLLLAALLVVWIARQACGLRSLSQVEQLRNSFDRMRKDPLDVAARERVVKRLHDYLRKVEASANSEEMDALRRLRAEIETEPEVQRWPDLLETALLERWDERAKTLIAREALNVGLITAVSPYGFIDALFTLWRNARMVVAVAKIYRVRPAAVGTLRLMGLVGAAFVTADISQQVGDMFSMAFGHSLRRWVSGIGQLMVNAVFTCRVGLFAQQLCRPMPLSPDKKRSVWKYFGPAVFEKIRSRKQHDNAQSPPD